MSPVGVNAVLRSRRAFAQPSTSFAAASPAKAAAVDVGCDVAHGLVGSWPSCKSRNAHGSTVFSPGALADKQQASAPVSLATSSRRRRGQARRHTRFRPDAGTVKSVQDRRQDCRDVRVQGRRRRPSTRTIWIWAPLTAVFFIFSTDSASACGQVGSAQEFGAVIRGRMSGRCWATSECFRQARRNGVLGCGVILAERQACRCVGGRCGRRPGGRGRAEQVARLPSSQFWGRRQGHRHSGPVGNALGKLQFFGRTVAAGLELRQAFCFASARRLRR